mgnify:CR=1 FL=1
MNSIIIYEIKYLFFIRIFVFNINIILPFFMFYVLKSDAIKYFHYLKFDKNSEYYLKLY